MTTPNFQKFYPFGETRPERSAAETDPGTSNASTTKSYQKFTVAEMKSMILNSVFTDSLQLFFDIVQPRPANSATDSERMCGVLEQHQVAPRKLH
jgi:hypothetical protein